MFHKNVLTILCITSIHFRRERIKKSPLPTSGDRTLFVIFGRPFEPVNSPEQPNDRNENQDRVQGIEPL